MAPEVPSARTAAQGLTPAIAVANHSAGAAAHTDFRHREAWSKTSGSLSQVILRGSTPGGGVSLEETASQLTRNPGSSRAQLKPLADLLAPPRITRQLMTFAVARHNPPHGGRITISFGRAARPGGALSPLTEEFTDLDAGPGAGGALGVGVRTLGALSRRSGVPLVGSWRVRLLSRRVDRLLGRIAHRLRRGSESTPRPGTGAAVARRG